MVLPTPTRHRCTNIVMYLPCLSVSMTLLLGVDNVSEIEILILS